MLCENVDLACLTSVCDAVQLYTDAALVLDASTHVAAVSGSGASIYTTCTSTVDLATFSVHDLMLEVLRVNVDLACLTSVSGTEQLYTDAAFMLDASTHVAAVSGSGAIIIDLHSMHKHSRLFPFLRAPHALRER